MTDFDTLIKTAVEKGATDIHISSSIPPRMRVNEELLPMRIGEPLDFALITSQIQGCLDEVLRRKVERSLANFEDVDFSFTIPSVTRVRANMYTSTSGRNIALRLIPLRRMTCDQIGIPDPVCQITDKASGLFIVTGPNGAGKTSTLAALIDRMNETRNIHILTLEDPVEYVFESKKALINQREIGTHSPDFAHALRSSVRENPDVLILGEMRDLDATRAALELAETGHLVFATLHTRTSISTVDRLISLFPADEQPLVRNMIAGSLLGVLAQVLMARNGGGLVPAFELLLSTPAVRNLIREQRLAQIETVIQTSSNIGMIKLEDYMMKLVERGIVSPREALSKTFDRNALLERMKSDPRFASLASGR